ncbi:hypothetical protein TRFO_17495 [Tritrichomonas foetus]|uniref:RRM domain-containing protein n=1 Tax=Tritrichomonas foetus TaxID=1144522 RepID=A0A1J4KMW4_9EUKA|nr:hypothetical protein TRFO_17495 [Tritrichomonas foetus]|eukprot:OHT12663.1 hypothetical protein TRFO_17495 [Tritrichomonas foetus]
MNQDDVQTLMNDYNQNPSPETFTRLATFLKQNQRYNDLLEIRMSYISQFSMNEDMWLQWLEEEYKTEGDNSLYDQLLQMALNDLPLSIPLWKFKIEHAKQKSAAIEEAINKIGEFDNSIWDEYRKLQPEKSDEIYEKQLSLPVPDYDTILGDYQLERVMAGKDSFDPPKEIKEEVARMNVYKTNFESLSSAIEYVKAFPDQKNFEYALSKHPYSPHIWIDYLNFFPSESLAARAVRFCPRSGLLRAIYAKITHKVDTSGFLFIKDEADAQLLLGQLISLDKNNAIPLIEAALKFPVFSEKNSWIWPTFLLEEHMKMNGATIDERKMVIEKAIERNSQSLELWNKLISIVSETGNEESIRKVYQDAASKLKVELPFLIQNWIIFETTAKDSKINEVIHRLNEIGNSSQKDVSNDDEKSASSIKNEYDRKTIFVANFHDSVTEEDLNNFFSSIGEIESIRLKRKHGKPSYAFIQFRYEKSAQKSIQLLNGAMFKGNSIEVKPHVEQKKFTLFIKFGSSAQPIELIDFLKEKTGVENFILRLANESKDQRSSHKTKGWGFIDVQSDTDAMKMLGMSGKLFKTTILKIEVAHKAQKEAIQDKKLKNKNPSSQQNNQHKYQQIHIPKQHHFSQNQNMNEQNQKEENSLAQQPKSAQMNDEQMKNFFGL